jgi:hypothetical protein
VKFVKRHPVFVTIVALLVLVIMAEVFYVYVLRSRVTSAEQDVHRRIAEIDQLQRQKPTPMGENLRLARDDAARSGEVLANMLHVLNVTGPDDLDFFKGEPTTRPDAWFEISQFVDRMTNEARTSNVELKPDERFGFTAFANEGPEPAFIRSVYRQHRIIEYLLGKLFAARPRALIAVQREEPAPLVAAGGAAAPAPSPTPAPRSVAGSRSQPGGGTIGEIFVIDPQVSARTPGYVDTLAFRIIFSGQTTSLRGFMNALAAPDIPLVVRSVEVAENAASATPRPGAPLPAASRSPNPFVRPPPATPAQPATSTAAVPIVAENVSVFTVTIELFDVKIRAPQVTASAASP